MEPEHASLPIGRHGRLEALGLTGPDGDHAVLVRHAEEPRALVTSEAAAGGRERLVVTPLDDDVDVRVDGDALAIWLASAPVTPRGMSNAEVPAWANLAGLVLLLALVAFAVVGSATVFVWLLGLLGLR